MSESTTAAPAAPAAPAPASTDSGPVIGPAVTARHEAAASQPALSISDAARLLNQQRRKDAGVPPAAETTDRKPSPSQAATARNEAGRQEAAAAARKPAEATSATPAPKPVDTGLSALERALGVPGGAPPESTTPADASGTIEIEGQRYSTAQLREAIGKATDYTKKTQAIAEQQRHLQAQQEAIATVLPYIQPELAKLAEIVQAQQAKPDIALMETDPQRYFRELHAYEQIRAEQDRLGNLTVLQQQAHQRAIEAQVAQANEVLAKEFPFWANDADRAAAQNQIVEWATTKGGFNRDELRGLTDPRALKTMMKAMQFDKWVSGTRTTAPTQATAAPARGTPPPPAPTERIQVAEQQFDQRPNIRNAAQLLAARRGNGSMPR